MPDPPAVKAALAMLTAGLDGKRDMDGPVRFLVEEAGTLETLMAMAALFVGLLESLNEAVPGGAEFVLRAMGTAAARNERT